MVEDVSRIRAVLEKLGWSESQLARESGCAQPTINLFLKGKRKLSPAASDRVLTALKTAYSQQKIGQSKLSLRDLMPPREPQQYKVWKQRMFSSLNSCAEAKEIRKRNAELEQTVAALQERVAALEELKTLQAELINTMRQRLEEGIG